MLSVISLLRCLLYEILLHIAMFGIASLFLGGVIGQVTAVLFGEEVLGALIIVVAVVLGALLGAIFGGLLATSDWRWTRRTQNQLRLRGLYDGPSDGWLNSDTRKALLEFQRLERLPKTGRF